MIAVGSAITTITLENTSAGALASVPVTFGQAFKKGDLPAAGAAVELKAADNSLIPCQFDARAFHADGSIRHAVLSAIVPALAASASSTYSILRKSAGAAPTPAVPGDFAGLDAVVTVTEGGTAYSVSLAALLAGSKTTWLAGDVVSEWEVAAPLKTADNVEHAHLHVRCYVRAYKGQAKARIDITVENTWAWNPAPQDVTGDVAMTVGGTTVYTKAGLVHHPRTRYRKIVWWNAVEPPIHIGHDIGYLIATSAVPNYDRTVTPDAAAATTFKNNTITNGEPMGAGTASPYMPATGGRPDIGLLPGWTALYLIGMHRDAKTATLNQGSLAGSWGMHFRDKNTGRVLSFNDWPYFSTTGTSGDAANPATGQSERAPTLVTNTNANTSDVSHHPDQAYVPYLVTGDVYYLEELQFWAQSVIIAQNPHDTARGGARGWMLRDQIRAQAWAMRSLAHAAYISPPGIKKTEFEGLLKSNIDWYDARYTNNTSDEAKLGAILNAFDQGMGYAFTVGEGNGIAPWQDDHFTSSIGRAVELGFEFARPLLNWKAQFTVGRLYGAPGYCWIQAAAYGLRVRDTTGSAYYTTLKQVYDNSFSPAMIAAAADSNCGTQTMADAWLGYNTWRTTVTPNRMYMDGVSNPYLGDMDGYSDSNSGYPSNLQPAIAYCASFGAPNAGNGWTVFDGRTVKPNYGASPQFSIIPRQQEATAVTAPADNYQVASGQVMYFGKAAPVTSTDNVYAGFAGTFANVPAPTAGAGGGTPESFGPGVYDNKPLQLELHGSSGQNYSTGWRYSVPVAGRMAYPGFTTCNFSLVSGDDGTNRIVKLRPIDEYGIFPGNNQRRESFFGGFQNLGTSDMTMTTARQMDAMMQWALSNLSQYDLTRTSVAGGSMGADACFRYGIRRPQYFAAVYSDRGRWRYAGIGTKMMVPDWASNIQVMDVSVVPAIAPEDGGGNFRDWHDGISYVSNAANKLPWIGWGMGTADANYTMADHNAAMVALRARKAGFCFVWSAAGHDVTTLPRIYASYPPSMFQLGKSYPYFSEHSLDKNPLVDAAGGINEGLSFRNVVDTAGVWSCDIKHISTACTVKVEPCNPVNFPAGALAQTITLPANTWVTVTHVAQAQ